MRLGTVGPVLDAMLREGLLDYVRPVAIVNRLLIEGRAEGILKLAEHETVDN